MSTSYEQRLLAPSPRVSLSHLSRASEQNTLECIEHILLEYFECLLWRTGQIMLDNVPAMPSKGFRSINLSVCTEPKRCILFLVYTFLKAKSTIWRTFYENQSFNLAMNPLLGIAIVVCWLFFFSFSYNLSYSSASTKNSSPQPFDNETS